MKKKKPAGEKAIYRPDLRLKLRSFEMKGRTGLGSEIILESLRDIGVGRRVKSKLRNPDRVHVFTLPFDIGRVNLSYYKNSEKFYGHIEHGIHRDSRNYSEKMLLDFICRLLYVMKKKKQPIGFAWLKMRRLVNRLIDRI